MLHKIDGPHVNKVDPWRKQSHIFRSSLPQDITTSTIFLSEFTLSKINGSSGDVIYDNLDSSSPEFEYILIIQLAGSCNVEGPEHNVSLHSHEAMLLSDNQPWNLHFKSNHFQIALRFHHAYLTPLLAKKDIRLMTIFRVDKGVGKLLLQYLIELEFELKNGHITQSTSVFLTRTIVNLVATCLIELNAVNDRKQSATYDYHVFRVKNYVAENLRNSQLNIQTISAALNISPPHLHRIFKNEPLSISHYLWQKRLQGCAKDLSDELKNNESISTIAFSWGFNDVAHFSRVFKEMYGVPPSKWRKKNMK